MQIDGWAFKENEAELREQAKLRFEQIKHFSASLNIRKSPQYGQVEFFGDLPTDETRQLSEKDLALIADDGNLCFGGRCVKSGNRFRGAYYTD